MTAARAHDTVLDLLRPDDLDAIVDLSLRAWAPVFASFEHVLGPGLYRRIYPDWPTSQAAAVREVCSTARVWVARRDGIAVGFAAVVVRAEQHSAEIDMIAVDPEHQRQGIARQLINTVVETLAAEGSTLVEIATGGDEGHAAARRTYEAAGFTALPLVRYYRQV